MTSLTQLPAIEGSTHRRKIVGRGRATGHGKTSTKGHKGQSSRTGFRQRPGFESGHIPLYRRLPRRGFSNARFAVEFDTFNVGQLEGKFAAKSEVDIIALKKAGLVRSNSELVKVLGAGELKTALTLRVHAISASAKAKVEKAGGKVELMVVTDEAKAEETK